jgi:hypothetical protein
MINFHSEQVSATHKFWYFFIAEYQELSFLKYDYPIHPIEIDGDHHMHIDMIIPPRLAG